MTYIQKVEHRFNAAIALYEKLNLGTSTQLLHEPETALDELGYQWDNELCQWRMVRRNGDDEDERYPDHPVNDVLYPVPF